MEFDYFYFASRSSFTTYESLICNYNFLIKFSVCYFSNYSAFILCNSISYTLAKLPYDNGVFLSWANKSRICMKLHFGNHMGMLLQNAYHVILELGLPLVFFLRVRHIPYSNMMIFIAWWSNPVSIWSPTDTCNLLGVFFDVIGQINSICILLLWVDMPNKHLSVPAHS